MEARRDLAVTVLLVREKNAECRLIAENLHVGREKCIRHIGLDRLGQSLVDKERLHRVICAG